jgi:hypothetical protein
MARAALALLLLVPVLLVPPALANGTVDVLLSGAGSVMAAALPGDGSSVLLIGRAPAFVARSGAQAMCASESTFVLEASVKPFGLEPTATMTYGGGNATDAQFALPCAMGKAWTPIAPYVHGSFAGAWYAEQVQGGSLWRLDVGAPEHDQRSVHFRVTGPDGGVTDQLDLMGVQFR